VTAVHEPIDSSNTLPPLVIFNFPPQRLVLFLLLYLTTIFFFSKRNNVIKQRKTCCGPKQCSLCNRSDFFQLTNWYNREISLEMKISYTLCIVFTMLSKIVIRIEITWLNFVCVKNKLFSSDVGLIFIAKIHYCRIFFNFIIPIIFNICNSIIIAVLCNMSLKVSGT